MERKQAKQLIIVRTDIIMPSGKLAAQVAHASLACILDHMISTKNTDDNLCPYERILQLHPNTAIREWLENRFIKIVVGCDSLEELLKIADETKKRGIHTAVIKDAGLTVFSEPTITCVGIGPCFPEEIDDITRNLKLIR